MLRQLGRALQYLGLAVLPLGVLLELSGALGRSFGVADLLKSLGFGVAAFLIGRLIEGYSK